MNPEIRFRVPEHVLERADQMALQYGLPAQKGKTGGAAQLARGALYTALGLALPQDLHQLQRDSFAAVREVRRAYDEGRPHLRVEVHHRVHPDYRKDRVLREGRPVAARTTTVLEFEQGELPAFLVPYVMLSDNGLPFVSINLEGKISPRPHALGELISAQERCGLAELEDCLRQIKADQLARRGRAEEREARRIKGEKVLRKWTGRHGSELLQARMNGGFSWLELAEQEYAQHLLHGLGIPNAVALNDILGLSPGQAGPRWNEQPEPTLASMKRLKTLASLREDGGVHSRAVIYQNQRGQSCEAILLRVETPMPGRRSFLLDPILIETSPSPREANRHGL